MREHTAWVPGELAVIVSGATPDRVAVVQIQRLTPTGQVVVQGGRRFRSSGEEIGAHASQCSLLRTLDDARAWSGRLLVQAREALALSLRAIERFAVRLAKAAQGGELDQVETEAAGITRQLAEFPRLRRELDEARAIARKLRDARPLQEPVRA